MSETNMVHKLWLACKSLSIKQPAFTLEDIAVACFIGFPKEFSMKGHNYPDTRKISANYMSGPRSMLKTGALVKTPSGLYALGTEPIATKYAHQRAYRNKPKPEGKTPDRGWMRDILISTAAKKLRGEMRGPINATDAMSVLKIRKISGLTRAALVKAQSKLRDLEMQQDSQPFVGIQPDLNFIRCVLDKVTPIVHRYDKVNKHEKSTSSQDAATDDVV